ncbi:MAG: hypothetical protein ABL883_06320 [Terricaulis sp.]
MSRLLQVVIALVGLAITGVLGLASERSEGLQARHTLIGLFTETVATARTTCDADLAEMAQFALEQLQRLESSSRLLLTAEDRADRENTQALLSKYQDIMAGVKGTIDSGACAGTAIASVEPSPVSAASGSGSGAGPADDQPSAAPPILSQAPAQSNREFRSAERIQLPEVIERARQRRAPAGEAQDGVAPAPSAAAAADGGYYAVLASYAVDDPATYDGQRGVVADYRRLSAAAREGGATVQVFRTSQSNHFAIVLVPEGLSRDGARELVAMARTRGWSRDAFVQAANQWVTCAEPERISRSNSCAN